MRATARKQALKEERRQVNIRLEPALYQALETFARQDRRSISQAARHMLEEGLRQRVGGGATAEDTSSTEIATLAAAGGSFDWLADEPDLYDDTCGEPV